MARNPPLSDAEAEVIALKALTFLASDSERLDRFIGLTGLGPEAIRAQAGQRSFLGGVLEYLRSDQTLLLTFAETEGVNPQSADAAQIRLSGHPA